MSLQPSHIVKVDRSTPSFYRASIAFGGYSVEVSPFLRWVVIYKDGKFIGKIEGKCHWSYIIAFSKKVYNAIENGAECSEWNKTCLLDDINYKRITNNYL